MNEPCPKGGAKEWSLKRAPGGAGKPGPAGERTNNGMNEPCPKGGAKEWSL